MSHYQLNSPARWRSLLPKPDAHSHKYSRGYVLIQGGYPVTGAARLSALAAARSGAGITAIAVPEAALPIYASQLLSIMAKPYRDQDSLKSLIEDTRVGAFLIGPGAGVTEETRTTTESMLDTGKSVVIDADALTAFQGRLGSLIKRIQSPCVLTPHDGEFERLFGILPSSKPADRINQVLEAASQTQAIVLLKGAQTIIASPDNRVIINDNAPPTLATAGAGDVLAGLITGLLAQCMPVFEATATAAWIHGEAARLFGDGLIADDLPAMIPQVLKTLHNR